MQAATAQHISIVLNHAWSNSIEIYALTLSLAKIFSYLIFSYRRIFLARERVGAGGTGSYCGLAANMQREN